MGKYSQPRLYSKLLQQGREIELSLTELMQENFMWWNEAMEKLWRTLEEGQSM
jgi:hypothetical protein